MSNPALTGITGMSSLDSIGGDLLFTSNASLASVTVPSNLDSIGGGLSISNNDTLATISGSATLTTADSRLADLVQKLPDLRASNHVTDRIAYARDLWPGGQIEKLAGQYAPEPPLAIVWPRDVEELVALVEWAMERQVVLVPFGAGSGVCGGTMAGTGSLIVDLKEMDRVLWVKPEANLVRVQSGMIGWHLEDRLGEEGLTLGHFPSSLMCSTMGGYLATRSAGQCSSLYGKIEDMAVSMQVVTAAWFRHS